MAVDSRLKLLQRLKLQLAGYVYVGNQMREGWKDSLPHYAFRCPEHGVIVDYPHGYENRLRCPLCSAEEAEKNKIRVAP